MISKEFFKALDALCEERGLEKDKILLVMEKGIVNAYKKEYGNASAKVVFNEDKYEIQIYQVYTVVEDEEAFEENGLITVEEAKEYKKSPRIGDVIEIKRTPKDFGRIAANTTKQILTQEIRRLEREKVYDFFKEKENEMVTGTIASMNDEYVTFNLGYDVQSSMLKKEIGKDECFVGSKQKVYITKVEMTPKGAKVYISRMDKNIIKRLLENAIPEISDGTIEIMGLARDAGDRTKLCVATNDPNVDPVGACLGQKGRRIKDVTDALNGEKIDIYAYSTNPKDLVANSLKPAEVLSVNINQREKSAVAIVPDDQLSLAIGKKGQNARLAVQSSGWKIDIKCVTDALNEGIDF